jgi:hypothetical protein
LDKYESRRIKTEIRHVLINVWDPIGIKDEPNARDEYDSYLGDVFDLLIQGATDDSIGSHLHEIVTVRMCLNAPKEAMQNTVEALRRIRLV